MIKVVMARSHADAVPRASACTLQPHALGTMSACSSRAFNSLTNGACDAGKLERQFCRDVFFQAVFGVLYGPKRAPFACFLNTRRCFGRVLSLPCYKSQVKGENLNVSILCVLCRASPLRP